MTSVRRIGFAYNPTNEAADELRDRAEGWCGVRGIAHWSAPSVELERLVAELPTTDVLVVLGGDGTFLRAARAVSEVDVPLLGVNLGKVGFLSKVEADGLEATLAQIAAGQFTVDERMTLRGVIRPAGRTGGREFFALNDRRWSPARGSWPRVVGLDASRCGGDAPATPHRRRPDRGQPDRLDRLLVLGRRPDPRPAQPEPGRHPDRRAICRPSARSWSARPRP